MKVRHSSSSKCVRQLSKVVYSVLISSRLSGLISLLHSSIRNSSSLRYASLTTHVTNDLYLFLYLNIIVFTLLFGLRSNEFLAEVQTFRISVHKRPWPLSVSRYISLYPPHVETSLHILGS